jgi:U4/U6.U5 tri-snRNP component SNU23
MSTNLNYKQVANVARRTWDRETYEKRAQDRANHESGRTTTARTDSSSTATATAIAGGGGGTTDNGGGRKGEDQEREEFLPAAVGAAGPPLSRRAFLKARTGRLDDVIDSKIGSVEIVHPDAVATTTTATTSIAGGNNQTAVTKSGVGWHCKVCDCFLRDSLTYLDHINGKKHQRNLGYSMRVERSTNDQLMARLAVLAKEKEASKAKANDLMMDGYDEQEEGGGYYNDIVKAKDEELAKRKEERKQERKEKKKKKKEEIMATGHHQQEQENDVVEDNAAFTKVTTTAEQPENDDDQEEEDGVDPGLAAMMGFSGFGGGSKKK